MPKQQITIEVDVPEGWEFVRYGMPKSGEHWLDGCRMIHCAAFDYQDTACVIIQNAWQWPAWLKAEWIAMQPNCHWEAFAREPEVCASGERWRSGAHLTCFAFDFTPPPCTDWRQSKRRRPGS